MRSPAVVSVFYLSFFFLIASSLAVDFRCYLDLTPAAKESTTRDSKPSDADYVRKCVLTNSKEFAIDDSSNIDLKLDPTKKTFVYKVSITNDPTSSQTVNGKISVEAVDLSALAKDAIYGQSTKKNAGIMCPNCYDSTGKPTTDGCIFIPTEIHLSSIPLSDIGDAEVRFLLCNIDSSVLMEKDDAAAKCPKSILSANIPATGKVKTSNTLYLGLLTIPECIDADGKVTSGLRVLINPSFKHKVIMNVCNINYDTRYKDEKLGTITPSFSIAHKATLVEGTPYKSTGVAELIPVASPAYYSLFSCGYVRQANFPDEEVQNPFVIHMKNPQKAPLFEKDWKSVGDSESNRSYGAYLDEQEKESEKEII
jgi:hypothetical protein